MTKNKKIALLSFIAFSIVGGGTAYALTSLTPGQHAFTQEEGKIVSIDASAGTAMVEYQLAGVGTTTETKSETINPAKILVLDRNDAIIEDISLLSVSDEVALYFRTANETHVLYALKDLDLKVKNKNDKTPADKGAGNNRGRHGFAGVSEDREKNTLNDNNPGGKKESCICGTQEAASEYNAEHGNSLRPTDPGQGSGGKPDDKSDDINDGEREHGFEKSVGNAGGKGKSNLHKSAMDTDVKQGSTLETENMTDPGTASQQETDTDSGDKG